MLNNNNILIFSSIRYLSLKSYSGQDIFLQELSLISPLCLISDALFRTQDVFTRSALYDLEAHKNMFICLYFTLQIRE